MRGASCGRDNGLRRAAVRRGEHAPALRRRGGAARGLRERALAPREGHTRRPRAQPRYGARNRPAPYARTPGWSRFSPEIGQDVHISGDFESAVQEGVRRGYAEGYLRKSMVADPLRRVNTGDNTPANIAVRLVPGESVRLTVSPKGAGSENMCRVKMLTPAEGEAGVRGIRARYGPRRRRQPLPAHSRGRRHRRPASTPSRASPAARCSGPWGSEGTRDEYYAAMESSQLAEINALGIGPQGLGGRTTALAVMVEGRAPRISPCCPPPCASAATPTGTRRRCS